MRSHDFYICSFYYFLWRGRSSSTIIRLVFLFVFVSLITTIPRYQWLYIEVIGRFPALTCQPVVLLHCALFCVLLCTWYVVFLLCVSCVLLFFLTKKRHPRACFGLLLSIICSIRNQTTFIYFVISWRQGYHRSFLPVVIPAKLCMRGARAAHLWQRSSVEDCEIIPREHTARTVGGGTLRFSDCSGEKTLMRMKPVHDLWGEKRHVSICFTSVYVLPWYVLRLPTRKYGFSACPFAVHDVRHAFRGGAGGGCTHHCNQRMHAL